MPAIQNLFDFIVDDKLELSTENEHLKTKMGFYDGKCLEESVKIWRM